MGRLPWEEAWARRSSSTPAPTGKQPPRTTWNDIWRGSRASSERNLRRFSNLLKCRSSTIEETLGPPPSHMYEGIFGTLCESCQWKGFAQKEVFTHGVYVTKRHWQQKGPFVGRLSTFGEAREPPPTEPPRPNVALPSGITRIKVAAERMCLSNKNSKPNWIAAFYGLQ